MKLRLFCLAGFLVLGSVFIVGCPGKTTTPTAPAPVTIYWSATPSFTPTQACFVGTSPTCTPTFTFTFTNTFTITNTPTNTFSPTPTYSPTNTLSTTYTFSSTPTNTPTFTNTVVSSVTPTATCDLTTVFQNVSLKNWNFQVYAAISYGVGETNSCLIGVPITIVFNHLGNPSTILGSFIADGGSTSCVFNQTLPVVSPGDGFQVSFNYLGTLYSGSYTSSSLTGCGTYIFGGVGGAEFGADFTVPGCTWSGNVTVTGGTCGVSCVCGVGLSYAWNGTLSQNGSNLTFDLSVAGGSPITLTGTISGTTAVLTGYDYSNGETATVNLTFGNNNQSFSGTVTEPNQCNLSVSGSSS